MRTISTLEPTRHEITARHPDGREYLICYSAGSRSGRQLRHIIWERARLLIERLKLPDDCAMRVIMQPYPHVMLGEWRLGYTGRTQRDVRSGPEHPFIAA